MKTGAHNLRDHLRLIVPLFGVITAVWALRLVMDLAHCPASAVRMASVNVAGSVAVLVAVVLIHFKRFGGYPSIVLTAFLLTAWEQVLVVLAILATVLTGWVNIYTAPEYSYGGSHLRHIVGHLTFGLGLEGLLAAAMGCALLWILRRLVPVTVLTASGKHVIQR